MDDHYLTRFLRARQYDMEKTMLMWTDFCKWRDSNSVATIIQNYEFPKLEGLQDTYPHGYHKVCKKGRSIYLDRIGMTSLEKINQVVTNEELVYHNIHSYEELILKKMHVLSIEQGKRVE
jgi:hypothetical protein